MGGSADPEGPTPTPTPSPSPAKASPPSTDSKRLRRCVQSKLSWGLVKPAAGVGGGGSGGGGEAEAGPSVPAAEVAVEGTAEPEKGNKRGRPRKSQARTKPSSNKETTGMDQASKDGTILVDESPQKKQRKGRKQDASLKVPNRKRCKALESHDGPGSCQQLHTVLPEASPVIIDIDIMSTPSEGHTNNNVDVLDNQDKSQLIVDLRSEAKMAAAENRKLSSGKKMHPFFASRKMNKGANQDANNIEDGHGLCDFERDPLFHPIHVVYQLEASVPVSWSNWKISAGSSLDANTPIPLQNSVSFFEGFVKPLTIESNCKRMCPSQLAEPIIEECTPSGTGLLSFTDNESKHSCPLEVIDVDKQCLLTSSSCQASTFDIEHPERLLHSCQPTYNLWTDKYRPETAAQVCGNSEHVKFLAEWLKSWDEGGHKIGAENGDTNDRLYQDESDAEYSDDSSDCENVLLITGPVGCGKSAAVFACAKEQGFNVIEVNTSDMRNGAYVRQKFEEATKSHGLEKWSQEDGINTPRDDFIDPAPGTPEYQHSISNFTTIAFDSNKQKSPVEYHSTPKVNAEASKNVVNKTLILFEDVDTVFDEDRGFISTILKMAETTKWPIIMTSNRKDPTLPNLLDQLVLDFKYPSNSELLSHVDMICKSEGLDVSISQLKYVIDVCLGDIRRTVMLLQFWCQGKQQFTESPKKCLSGLSGPFSHYLEAVHCTLPKMLPWEFPCKLSETICIEVDKTIHLAEEKKKQMEVSELEGLQLQVTTPLSKGRCKVKTRKAKKPKLKRGHSDECSDLSSPCKNELDDFHALPGILLSPDQQRKRNRNRVLLLSDSDDELADRHTGKDAVFTVKEGFTLSPEGPHIHGQGILEQFPFPIESMKAFGITDSFQNPLESNMTGSISQVCDTFMSQGMSCVPESSFIVGGTSASMSGDELLSGAVSNEFSAFYNGGAYTTSRMLLEDTDNAKYLMAEQAEVVEDEVAETSEAYVESSCRNELASCSAGYPVMDECSQAGSIWLFSAKKVKDSCKVEQVQDTWNRLRNYCPELPRETNHNRVACGALKLASRVSDLLSESDLLLSCCHPLTNDMVDPFSVPFDEPDDSSWYNNEVEMGSVYAQHALCIFSRKSQDIGDECIDLSRELLFASKTAMSLGKIISSGLRSNDGSVNASHMKNPTTCILERRERHVHLCEALSSVVPSKLSHSLRGPAFVDYLSAISQISRIENLRISESSTINKQKRSRQSRHYLSSGALSLSPEDVVLLGENGSFSDRL